MIAAVAFEFPNGTVNCVGTIESINRVRNYFRWWDQHFGKQIDMGKFVERIVKNEVYALVEPKGVKEVLLEKVRGYNQFLKNHDLLITEDEFIEAMVLAYPDVCCKELELSEEEFEHIKKESIWNKRIGLR